MLPIPQHNRATANNRFIFNCIFWKFKYHTFNGVVQNKFTAFGGEISAWLSGASRRKIFHEGLCKKYFHGASRQI
jgi:hypothetical protein